MMAIAEFIAQRWNDTLRIMENSEAFHDALVFGAIILIIICVLAVLLGITIILRQFFRHHPFITRAQRILIYLLTMAGVVALLIAGILGLFLPIIPGFVFILAGFLLMRRYHRWNWLDGKIALLRRKLHQARIRHRRKKALRAQQREAQRLAQRQAKEARNQERNQEKVNKYRGAYRRQRR